ncbi:hypothetical protein M8J77_019477 [Diaphorina citri]|nr:hypothetical protein M8J77_019477 [Diaphorina citri]
MMEGLKKERSMLRTSLTKASKNIKAILQKDCLSEEDGSDLESILSVMSQRFIEVRDKDKVILENLSKEDADEGTLEEEQEKVDHYCLLYEQARLLVEKALRVNQVVEAASPPRSEAAVSQECNRKYKLPTLKLKQFNGELQDWLPFWSQFDKIHSDPNLDEIDKFGYLTMSMVPGTAGHKLVESYPATRELYPQVISALQARFGRTDLLTEYYIREMLKLIIDSSAHKDKLSIVSLYDKLQSHLRNLESLGVTSQNYAPILLPLVSSCVPEHMLRLWERTASNNSSSVDTLDNLLLFLKIEVESSQKVELAKKGFGMSTQSSSNVRREPKKSLSNNDIIPTATGFINTASLTSVICIFCKGNHKTQECREEKSLEEKRRLVNETHVQREGKARRERIEALDQTKICGNVSTVPEGSWLEELKAEGIEISDVGSSTDIDILLGSDIAGKLWSGKCVQLKSGLVAMETHLGWTLSGKLPISTTMLSDNIATVVTNLYVKEANITDLWTLDVLGIKDPTENASKLDIERITQEHFLSTVRVNEDNRFEIHLPWLENHPPLGENYLLALKRLQSTVKKLKKDNYYNDYKKVLDNW